MRYLLVILIFCSQINQGLQAQILNRLKQRIENEVVDRVADKVAEKIVDEIEAKMYKSAEDTFDEAVKEQYKDSTGNESVDPEAFSKWLSGFSTSADKLRETYQFDIVNQTLVKDGNGDENMMDMMYGKHGEYFGMRTEDNGNTSTMIFDLKHDIIALFSNSDNEQTVMAMPSMLSFASGMIDESEYSDVDVRKTNDTKTFCGYTCEGYLSTTEDYTTTSYVTTDFPVSWSEAYKAYFEKYIPTLSSDLESIEGMVMYSESVENGDDSKKSTMEVIKVIDGGEIVQTSDFTIKNVTENK